MSRDKWIIDGNYMYTLPMRLNRCDTVFFFDLPLDLCLAGAEERLGKRCEDMSWIDNEMPRNHINDNIASPLGDSRTEHFYIMTKEDYHAIHIS